MKSLLSVFVVGLLCAGSAEAPAMFETGQKGKKGASHGRPVADEPGVGASIHIAFSSREQDVVRHHYAPRYRNLPPGLQKKLARTGQLPPGWQKKMEPFPASLERELVTLPSGYHRGVIEGYAVIYNPRTHVIIDVVALF